MYKFYVDNPYTNNLVLNYTLYIMVKGNWGLKGDRLVTWNKKATINDSLSSIPPFTPSVNDQLLLGLRKKGILQNTKNMILETSEYPVRMSSENAFTAGGVNCSR